MQFATSILVALIVLAQAGVPKDPGPPPGAEDPSQASPGGAFGSTSSLVIMGVLFAFMYFFLFRPQQQKEKDEKSMLEKLKKNDHVVTRGGMIGVVMSVKDDEVVLKVDEEKNTKIRFRKDAIAQILSDGEKKEEEADKDKKG